MEWADSPVLTSPSKLIPFQFLKSDHEAIRVLKEYLTSAQEEYQHRVAMEKIKNVMETSQLIPGEWNVYPQGKQIFSTSWLGIWLNTCSVTIDPLCISMCRKA